MPSALSMTNAFMAACMHARELAKRDSEFAVVAERWEQKAARYEVQAVLTYDLAYEDVESLPEVEREAA